MKFILYTWGILASILILIGIWQTGIDSVKEYPIVIVCAAGFIGIINALEKGK